MELSIKAIRDLARKQGLRVEKSFEGDLFFVEARHPGQCRTLNGAILWVCVGHNKYKEMV